MRKGFTLVEVLIVTVIVGVLAYVIFRSYIVVTQIAFRIQQEKMVMREMVFVSQTLQNMTDTHTIALSAYPTGQLVQSDGMTDRLILSGEDSVISIYSTGNCIQPGIVITTGLDRDTHVCWLEMQRNDDTIILTDPRYVYMSRIVFKIIPHASTQQYISDSDGSLCRGPYIGCFNHPGFWMIGQAYTPTYNAMDRVHRVHIPIQQFFSF